jgi:hypothetical protein
MKPIARANLFTVSRLSNRERCSLRGIKRFIRWSESSKVNIADISSMRPLARFILADFFANLLFPLLCCAEAVLCFDFGLREKKMLRQLRSAIQAEFIASAYNWPFTFRTLEFCFHLHRSIHRPQSEAPPCSDANATRADSVTTSPRNHKSLCSRTSRPVAG